MSDTSCHAVGCDTANDDITMCCAKGCKAGPLSEGYMTEDGDAYCSLTCAGADFEASLSDICEMLAPEDSEPFLFWTTFGND